MSCRKYIETTANGHAVSVDLEHSHAATHLREQPGLWTLTQEVLRRSSVELGDVASETDMGRIVGRMDLVETYPNERRIYARRVNRQTFMPFVERNERPETSKVVVILKQLEIAQLDPSSLDPKLLEANLLNRIHRDLFSTYVGLKTPSLPGDPYETRESIPYWMNHALVLGSQAIQLETVTYECPWPLDGQTAKTSAG